MGNKRATITDRQTWRRLKEIGGLVGGVLLVTAILLGGAMLPGLLTDTASTAKPRITQAAQR